MPRCSNVAVHVRNEVQRRHAAPAHGRAGPDPLAGIEHTGDEEDDAPAELDALHRGFRERTARELERIQLATESEYWFCVCFKSQDDKDAFLAAAGLVVIGDKYLDGYVTAELLGITMPDPDEAERGELNASTQATDRRRSQEARRRPLEGHHRPQGQGTRQNVQRLRLAHYSASALVGYAPGCCQFASGTVSGLATRTSEGDAPKDAAPCLAQQVPKLVG